MHVLSTPWNLSLDQQKVNSGGKAHRCWHRSTLAPRAFAVAYMQLS